MSTLTFADLQAAANEEYEDFSFELPDGNTATFRPILRLPKEKRASITEIQKRDNWGTSEGYVGNIQNVFELRAATKADYRKLATALGDDGAMWVKLFDLAAAVDADTENPGEA
jgi:hypothetical protein